MTISTELNSLRSFLQDGKCAELPQELPKRAYRDPLFRKELKGLICQGQYPADQCIQRIRALLQQGFQERAERMWHAARLPVMREPMHEIIKKFSWYPALELVQKISVKYPLSIDDFQPLNQALGTLFKDTSLKHEMKNMKVTFPVAHLLAQIARSGREKNVRDCPNIIRARAYCYWANRKRDILTMINVVFCEDKKFVLKCVRTDGRLLYFAADSLKADKEVALAAVTQDPDAHEYVAKELQSDPDILAALE